MRRMLLWFSFVMFVTCSLPGGSLRLQEGSLFWVQGIFQPPYSAARKGNI